MAAAKKKPVPRGSQAGQKAGKKPGPVTITSGRRTGSSGPDLAAIAAGMGSSSRSAGKTGGSAARAAKTPPGQAKRKPRKRTKPKYGDTIVVA